MIPQIDLQANELQLVRNILNANLPESARVYVFGSRAAGRARKSSDLDLAIDAGRALTRREHAGLADAFDESDLFCSVDLVDLYDTGEIFLAIIKQQMVPLPGRI